MTSHTVVGVNGAVNPEQTSGWLVVGYDRTFATVIPRTGPNGQKGDAMSALACSRLATNGITIKRFTESIATGEAAKKFATNLDNTDTRSVKDFFDCFKTQTTPPTTGTPNAGSPSSGG